MKTRLFTFSLWAALTVSCSIQEADQNSVYYPTDQVFYAKMEVPAGDVETKVYVDDDLMVLWHADDRVSIFNKYTFNQEYRFTGKTGDNSGAFKKVESEDFITGNVLDNVYAVYPYQESTEISNQGVLTVTLPATQTYVKDSFGPGANTMVSCSENNELIFKNLCGYVMLKLYGDNVSVKSISIKGNNDEPLAGTATVNAVVESTPTLKFSSDASKEITLTFDSPVTIGTSEKTATTFWLVVPPTTFSKGFTLTVKDSKNWGFEKATSSSFKVERNSLARMAALAVIPEEPDASEEPIVFADQGIKEALVAKFDSNGDGELSYKEAAAVTSIEGVFGTKKTYTSFDEFQYFTGVTFIPKSMFEGWQISSIVLPESVSSIGPSAFHDCAKLTSVKIPDLVSSIGSYSFSGCVTLSSVYLPKLLKTIGGDAFSNCSSLSSISLPESVTSISSNAFSDCHSLTSINIPESVTSIGFAVFNGCSSLNNITVPESITSIGHHAFRECSNLSSINIPEAVTSIGSWAFLGCSSLTSINIPDNVYKIELMTFYRCSSLTSISISKSVTSIGNYAFGGCSSLSSIVIPESVTSIGEGAFDNCNQLKCVSVNSKIPPLASPNMIDKTCLSAIYVPAESVEAYKAAEYWSEYADRIQAIGTPMAVDLGLPSGLKWASFNLGATAPEGYGDYFAWGETEPYYISQDPLTWKDGKKGYNWTSYSLCNGAYYKLTKYCPENKTDFWDEMGSPDNKTVLDAEDDVAHVKLGGKWHMPTDEDWTELRNNCTWCWVTNYNGSGINGELVTSKVAGYTDKSIFLPAAGYRGGTPLNFVGSYGYYWSSTLNTDNPPSAWYVYFSPVDVRRSHNDRISGHSVRPVTR